MNELQLAFDYQTLPVRTITNGMDIWFVLKDVCDILGIKHPRYVWNRLEDDERGVGKIYTPGGLQDMQCVNEPGLYDTIIRSNSERAKPFRRWITHEVLPSIRKQGYYSLLSDDDLIEVITEKQRRDSEFLGKIDKTAIKAKLLKESRDLRDEETELLFLRQNEISCKQFRTELKSIWKDDMNMFHKHLDQYQKWYFKYGRTIVPSDEEVKI